ncbi:MAG: LysM peptidoglycan-binding domain-containing protein [Ilumatobacteraceae bacterium]
MSTSTTARRGARLALLAAATGSALGVVVGLPALLVVVASARFGHASPLHGLNAPWRWSTDDVRSWATRLTHGLDSSAALIDLFFRVALVVGWVCVAILIYTVVDELAFQLRRGMPSSRDRHFGGLGLLGRRVATALVAVLPLAISVAPTLAGAGPARAAVSVVHRRVADLDAPMDTAVSLPVAVNPTTSVSVLGTGWSMVEVKRGDSIWAIAERIGDGRDIAAIARQIVAANLGSVMNDGHRFSTPALIEPGWMLNVPVDEVPVVDTIPDLLVFTDDYVVVAGDSYWRIAETHLGPLASAPEIAAYVEALMERNAPLLGYADGRLIRPGDIVQLVTPEPLPVAGFPPVLAAADLPAVEVVPTIADPEPPTVVGFPPPVVLPSSTVAPDLAPPLVPPAATPGPSPAAATSPAVASFFENESNGIPMQRGLPAALLLSGGAIVVLDARRRQQLRSARIGARLLPPTPQAVETELRLRSLNRAEQLARVDLALRSAAPGLVRQQARALAIEIADDGEIRVYADRSAPVVGAPWLFDSEADAWRLPANVPLVDLADDARRVNQPCPALIHIGESAGGQLFVDLEAVGTFSIVAPPEVAASIVRCAAASLAVSPFAESSRIFTVGLEVDSHLGNPTVESHRSLGEAVEAVRATVGSIATATSGNTSTFALRSTEHGGEAWEPSLLLAVGVDDPADLGSLTTLARGGGCGVGAMIDRLLPGAGAVLRAADGDFVLEPLGRRVTPVGLSLGEVSAVDNLLDAAERPLPAAIIGTTSQPRSVVGPEFTDRPQVLVVQVLGRVAVHAADGQPVGFNRSKSQELVVWLSQHRQRPTRSSARTALWDVAVQDATFSNVVSDARRAMAIVVQPPAGQEWLGRTMNDDLPLHDLVVSDVELLAERVAGARGLAATSAIAVLRPGVALIEGMPFAGASYLWPDAEGITSALVLLSTLAAAELAGHYLSVGDIDGVFWATGRGLMVLAGHEELIALRMRAHALRGDLAGVRGEWDSYERAVHADSWAAAEPSPKLVHLRRELLSPSLAS